MLNLKSIRKDYVTASETVHALKGVSISFRKTEFVSILGPSGCGKTTLLNIIGGLDHYTDGDLMIGNRSTKEYGDRDWDVYRNHRVGFIFQSYNLIPHQTVLGNVELALTIAGISKEERIARAKEALDRVGLKGQYYKKPNQLSGGQCQRVAIARALVNNPEILLADEPTGALDTVTSVQIMDLIREIAKERLVVMVTHNPELAEEYSTRIVRLRDGEILEDTNPMTEEEIAAEIREEEAREAAELAELEALSEKEKAKKVKEKKKKKERAKMSFFTAFKLSAKNLWSKRGRTAMVGFAGSIGIIGIALVLAFSAGIKGYIASMQDDMLSGNPIIISETAYDFDIISDMMNDMAEEEKIPEKYKVYVDSLIDYMAKMNKFGNDFFIKNNLTKEYIDYVKAMPKEYYSAMTFDYGIDPNYSIFTNFTHTDGGGNEVTDRISIAALTSIYTSVLEETKYKDYAGSITQLVPSFKQAPNNKDYIASQYDVYGEIADEYNEVMLVLSKNQEVSDVLLARLGIYTEAQFYNLIYGTTHRYPSGNEGEEPDPMNEAMKELYNPALDVDSYDYDTLLSGNYTFTWYPNDVIYTDSTNPFNTFNYVYNAKDITAEGVDLKITGILVANEETNFGCLSSGIYYTEALTNYMLEQNKDSKIVNHINEKGEIVSMYTTIPGMGSVPVGVNYTYSYRHIVPVTLENGEVESIGTAIGFVGESLDIGDVIGSMSGSGGGGGSGDSAGGSGSAPEVDAETLMKIKTISLRMVAGNNVANNVSIYPVSFDDKDQVTNYLDGWSGEPVKYTDTLEMIISMINTMIDVVSYALIAFTSVSLVVSTVMIGIITYVSVVERVKEIGVIRSLGGRKKDVRHLFNAETFIIGSLAGLFGIGVTYFISVIVNLILKPFIGYSRIAALPIGQAIVLIMLSIGLTLISGLIPASSAAKKDPVVALRTE